jgi:hypothetical protein
MKERPDTMSNQEFIRFCFTRILRREPDDKGFADYVQALDSGSLTREETLLQFVTSEEFRAGRPAAGGEMFPPGHYYSAVPSAEDRMVFRPPVIGEHGLPGVRLNGRRQFELLQKFKAYYDQSPFSEKKTGRMRYYFDNPSYSYTDALTLYCMIREFRPRRIIEIGSGHTSCLMLDTNELFFDNAIQLTFIEPYPELLLSLIRKSDRGHRLIAEKLQDVDLGLFQTLEENDILFIDSTHVSKLNSDVNREILEILPVLKAGVLVHFHDIFWPFEYPVEWVRKGISWNEAYLLRAFLEFNDAFEVIYYSGYLHAFHAEWIQENMPLFLKNSGANIWLVRGTG